VHGLDIFNDMSRPTRARGLKLVQAKHDTLGKVAPHAGAWIETSQYFGEYVVKRRAPRGRVD